MFEKELVISGLSRQHDLLKELIDQLEMKPNFDTEDCYFYSERTGTVASNLRRLRRIKSQYDRYQETTERFSSNN